MATITCASISQTALLGQFLADYASLHIPYLLHGPLGSGKTTLVRSLVDKLDVAHAAEVSSPSFSIYNIYPAPVPIIHADLYRCRENFPPELLEYGESGLLIVEWAEYLRPRPDDYLDISIDMVDNIRLVSLCGYGRGKEIEHFLLPRWESGSSAEV